MAETRNQLVRKVSISAADREALVDALRSGYPNLDFLYLRLANKMGVDVAFDIVSLKEPGGVILDRIVTFAKGQGKFLELLGVAWSGAPGNPELKDLADKYFTDPAEILAKFAPLAAAPVAADHPALEKLIVSRSKLLNLKAFQAGLEQLSGAICTVSAAGAMGTGFLVGKRSVLTNYHVVEAAIKAKTAGDQILCAFDFATTGSPTVEVRGAQPWLLSSSPYSDSDLSGTGEPTMDELDYALITLKSEVEPGRKPLAWPSAPPIVAQRDFLVIGQHPGGGAAQIAFGEVVELPGSGLRYRYDVTTEPGSSGSPVLSLDLKLVGLHHAADPANKPKYNQAVSIARILKKLKRERISLSSL